MAVSAEPNSFLHHLMVAGCRATEQGFCERSSPEYRFRADGGPPRLSRWVWRPPRKVLVWRANGEAMAKGTAVRWGRGTLGTGHQTSITTLVCRQIEMLTG